MPSVANRHRLPMDGYCEVDLQMKCRLQNLQGVPYALNYRHSKRKNLGTFLYAYSGMKMVSLSEAASVGYAIAPTTKTNSRTIEPVRDDFYILGSIMLSPPILGCINP
jgi:hypothetical protein